MLDIKIQKHKRQEGNTPAHAKQEIPNIFVSHGKNSPIIVEKLKDCSHINK